jgi:hypothetical protein
MFLNDSGEFIPKVGKISRARISKGSTTTRTVSKEDTEDGKQHHIEITSSHQRFCIMISYFVSVTWPSTIVTVFDM